MNIHKNVNNLTTTLQNLVEASSQFISNIASVYSASDQLQTMTTRQIDELSSNVYHSSTGIRINRIGGSDSFFIVKRIIDILISSTVLILMLPLLAFLALLIRLDNTGAILVTEKRLTSRRYTKHKSTFWQIVPFNAYRFRSSQLSNPAIAYVLNTFCLAQLPTMFSVLRGDMSMIGSCTLIEDELESIENWQILSLACKPGIINLSRVSGNRKWLSGDDVRQDIWYAVHQSLLLDIKILLQTSSKVFSC